MKQFKVGLQLYSIRDAMKADMDASFKAVKEMGYDYVEFAGGTGDRTAPEIRQLLDKNGLSCISVHQSPTAFQNDPAQAIDFVKTLGAEYTVIPIYKLDNYLADWNGAVTLFIDMAKAAKENGLKQLYHNHDFEFTKLDGEYILDKLFASIPRGDLDPEFDTAWVHYAGFNPVSYIEKFSGHVEVVHLKDFSCTAFGDTPVWQWVAENGWENKPATKDAAGFSYQPVGWGIQDWNTILNACEKAGTEYVIVEQDESKDHSSLEAAAMSRVYLKDTFGI